jgi:hypothetical protein
MNESFIDFISILEKYSGTISVIILLGGLFWALLKFRIYIKDRRFGIYHALIKQLVEPEKGKKSLMLDRQIAIIFELRNFPEYYEVSKRILSGLKECWNNEKNERIVEEIDISMEYMKKNKVDRFIYKLIQFIKY